MDFYEQELWQYLKNTHKPIVLYGMGNGADKIINVLKEKEIPFQGVFASDGFVRNKSFHGHKIVSFSELEEKFGEMIVLLCFGSARPEVLENIRKISVRQELYAPEVPVIGGGLFTQKYLQDNILEFERVYNLLADDLSRKTFENTVKYKISGKLQYLYECETDEDEPYNNFLKLGSNESFLDLGAYNGDTVADFIKRVKSYNSIIAVEPDSKTFKKLVANTEGIENIRCENVCISDFHGLGAFGMRGGRNSGAENGKNEAQFTTIDRILGKEEATFIKMDIEGEEERAIKGAFNTITNLKPKMLISCYHRTEDLITLPKAVLNIRNDYRIYMRHFKSVPAWDTNYYFV